MEGKRGLVMGVANDHSIAWGIAQALSAHGADVTLSYQNDSFAKRVQPLAETIGAEMVRCDVAAEGEVEAMAAQLGDLDFIVHAVAYADRDELKGAYYETSRENFLNALDISCYSFTRLVRCFRDQLNPEASLLTLTYEGARRTMPSYNLMGVAKAALEASVRYLAADLGPAGIRVNALSAGPMRTLSGAAIAHARMTYRWQGEQAPLRRNVSMDEVANGALYLLSDLSSGVTGEILSVDSGYHVVGMVTDPAASSLS